MLFLFLVFKFLVKVNPLRNYYVILTIEITYSLELTVRHIPCPSDVHYEDDVGLHIPTELLPMTTNSTLDLNNKETIIL